jgi:hypothetical protein
MINFNNFIRCLRVGIDEEDIFDDGLMNDGSLFNEPLPLGVLLLIEDEDEPPLCLDEDVDNCDTSFFQKFILKMVYSNITVKSSYCSTWRVVVMIGWVTASTAIANDMVKILTATALMLCTIHYIFT